MKRIMIAVMAFNLILIPSGIQAQNCQSYFEYSHVPAQPYTIQFENLSVGNYAYCNWQFGDGTSSSEENPVHSYNAPGTYPVCLTIFDSLGFCNDTYCRDVLAGITNPCAASFEAVLDTLASEPNLYHFVNTSTGNMNTWYWDFGDGNTSAEFQPAHQYEQKGTYQVCLYAYDSMSPQVCFDNTCLTLATPDYLYFGGQLFADGFPINNPLNTGDTGFAYLYRITGNNLIAIDTNYFYNNLGLYVFNDLLPGKYLVKAGLTEDSENAGKYFPTYLTESVNWLTATILELQDTIYNANVYMKPVPVQSLSGICSVSGSVNIFNTLMDEYLPVEKPVEVMLFSEGLEPLTYTYTDGTGSFSFEQLDYGSYFLYADLTGWSGGYVSVTLDPAIWTLEAVSITLFPDATLDIAEVRGDPPLDIRIYPNPFKEILNIELELEKEELVILEIMDVCGKVVYSQSAHLQVGPKRICIPATGLTAGIYLISVRTPSRVYPVVNKVVH